VDVKKDIMWRAVVAYGLLLILGVAILSKAVYVQQVQGSYWRSLSDSMHLRMADVEAERGTIYSEDGQMLSTSIPQFNLYMDFAAEGLREKKGQRFKNNLDSLSICLANLFGDMSSASYKRMLLDGFNSKDRYFLLKKKISFREYQLLRQFPLFRLGKNKSGLIAEVKNIRLNPYQMLAFRTIGLDRDSFKVGLESRYDTLLKGTTGKRLVRYVANGVAIPVEDENAEIEAANGSDIITTLDMHIQEITENALMKMMVGNEADFGCAIVMEVKTGKIKAIANLGKRSAGVYWEDFNYAISPAEPGSTFKLVTVLAALEDKKVNLTTPLNLEGGVWQVNGQTVYDSERHGLSTVDVKKAFEVSSNVGMAKIAYQYYSAAPAQFLKHLKNLHLDTITGIDLSGERKPLIYKPGSRYWSATTLPWMAFGYNLAITPLHTAMLYNAVANNGVMLQPYLVTAQQENGKVLHQFEAQILNNAICSNTTLQQLKACLEGVCINGTARSLFKDAPYKAAGKTGTALVANGSRGYADKVYQSSFAGYFPANNPQYTIVVIIKNKPHATKFYGAEVAGPVWREIADRLYTSYVTQSNQQFAQTQKKDSGSYRYTASASSIQYAITAMHLKTATTNVGSYAVLQKNGNNTSIHPFIFPKNSIPDLKGMGLKDAVNICEALGLKVNIIGKGKITTQSLQPGVAYAKGQIITLQLN
jgi:cell division protein FtsI (penicillin-binding protein 3)